MSGIYIPGDKVPAKCVGCTFRDPEYGGNCILMPSFDAGTYEEQFERCPFKEIRKQFGSVPPHGDLMDRDVARGSIKPWSPEDERNACTFDTVKKLMHTMLDRAPIIIRADPAEEGE